MNLIVILMVFLMSLSPCYAEDKDQESLQTYRNEIDKLDTQLIQILGERMKQVTAIGQFKAKHKLPVLQTKRFEEILQKNIKLGQDAQLSEAFIRALMSAIHEESLAKEVLLQEINDRNIRQ